MHVICTNCKTHPMTVCAPYASHTPPWNLVPPTVCGLLINISDDWPTVSTAEYRELRVCVCVCEDSFTVCNLYTILMYFVHLMASLGALFRPCYVLLH